MTFHGRNGLRTGTDFWFACVMADSMAYGLHGLLKSIHGHGLNALWPTVHGLYGLYRGLRLMVKGYAVVSNGPSLIWVMAVCSVYGLNIILHDGFIKWQVASMIVPLENTTWSIGF